jgi:hypothetical protein
MEEHTVEALLATIDEAWDRFRALVTALPPAHWENSLGDGWTVKEMLAHVAFWEEAVLAYLPILRGQPAPAVADWYGGEGLNPDGEWPHFDVHNAREAAWARGKPPEEVLVRLDAAHRRTRALLAGLSGADLNIQQIWNLATENTVKHYLDHIADLQPVPPG